MQNALEEVNREMSVRAAAKIFNIPHSTLEDHVTGKSSKVGAGAPTVLSFSEEQEISHLPGFIRDELWHHKRAYSSGHIRLHQRKQHFNSICQWKDWWQHFLKRWPTLTERKPQHLSTRRAQAANADTVNGFFDWLESSLTEVGLNVVDPELPNCLWNCDETAKINLA